MKRIIEIPEHADEALRHGAALAKGQADKILDPESKYGPAMRDHAKDLLKYEHSMETLRQAIKAAEVDLSRQVLENLSREDLMEIAAKRKGLNDQYERLLLGKQEIITAYHSVQEALRKVHPREGGWDSRCPLCGAGDIGTIPHEKTCPFVLAGVVEAGKRS